MLPHVVCGRRVLDEREEGGETTFRLCVVSQTLPSTGSTLRPTSAGAKKLNFARFLRWTGIDEITKHFSGCSEVREMQVLNHK